MRPPLARIKQKLSHEEAIEVLESSLRGVLSVNGRDGYPYALPINHYYNKEDGKIYFHSGKAGYKLDCIKDSDKACFTVIDNGVRKEGDWWLTIRSVIAFGKIERIDDPETILRISRKLSYKFTSDDAYIDREIEKYAAATALLSFTPEEISGKVVREK